MKIAIAYLSVIVGAILGWTAHDGLTRPTVVAEDRAATYENHQRRDMSREVWWIVKTWKVEDRRNKSKRAGGQAPRPSHKSPASPRMGD
jgi:hypothetical protein